MNDDGFFIIVASLVALAGLWIGDSFYHKPDSYHWAVEVCEENEGLERFNDSCAHCLNGARFKR